MPEDQNPRNSTTVPAIPTKRMIQAGMDALWGFSCSEKWGPTDDDLAYYAERVWEEMTAAWSSE